MAIKRLDDAVVHKIAAGEIIVSPRNALKELLENAIDSGASRVDVQVADGGFKRLAVTDNGAGIDANDLAIVCQRFTTSKIVQFSDLESCTTLGFRGEALASISHISNLSIITKKRGQKVATLATYHDGLLTATKPIAGLDGTQVIVENLFYNHQSRIQALRGSKKTEYAAILDIVAKYAIQYPCTFTCTQKGDAQPTVYTTTGDRKQVIQSIYGSNVTSHLLDIEAQDPDNGLVSASGYISDLNYAGHRAIPFIFFVNGRLVECSPIQRAIKQIYYTHLPKSQVFVFLSLEIRAENVDVNTHPTKSQVTFLYQDEIIAAISAAVEEKLQSTDVSRSYSTQTLLTSTVPTTFAPCTPSPSSQRYEHKLVRTDPKQTTLTFARSTTKTLQPPQLSPRKNYRAQELHDEPSELPTLSPQSSEDSPLRKNQSNATQAQEINLVSISALKDKVNAEASILFTRLLAEHTYIGVVDTDRSLVAIQYDVRLYLADYKTLSYNLFYQIALVDFANYGTIHLGDGVNVQHLLDLVDPQPASSDMGDMAVMLEDYFKIKLVQQKDQLMVTQMPLLLTGYVPSMARLPQFFVSLNSLDWRNEAACLQGIIRALATWCIPVTPCNKELSTIFDALKTDFVATQDLKDTIVEIASLPGLYKVFERC